MPKSVIAPAVQSRIHAAEMRVNKQRMQYAEKHKRPLSIVKLKPGDVPHAMRQHMKRSADVTDADVAQDFATREMLREEQKDRGYAPVK
jgi:hypothetical protein